MNDLINSHAPIKKLNKNKESFKKTHGLQEVSKIQFIRKIDSLKNILNVATKTIKMLYITSIKLIETSYQL